MLTFNCYHIIIIVIKEESICLDEYLLRFSPVSGASICGCLECPDPYYVQIVEAHIGTEQEGKRQNDLDRKGNRNC